MHSERVKPCCKRIGLIDFLFHACKHLNPTGSLIAVKHLFSVGAQLQGSYWSHVDTKMAPKAFGR